MAKRWIFTATIDPTALTGTTVSGRFGNSVMFCAYSKPLRQWYWIFPGGEERIPEPPMIFVDEEWARENRSLGKRHKFEKPLAIRSKKPQQLLLF